MGKKIPISGGDVTKIGGHYDDAKHQYYWNGEPIGSTTGFIGEYTGKFNGTMVARHVARHSSSSAIKLQQLWEAQGNLGRAFGDFIHNSTEVWWLDRHKFLSYWGGLSPHQIAIDKMMTEITEKYDIIEMEKWRVSETYRLGYTPDFILKSKPGIYPVKYIVGDWKTTKITDNKDYRNFKEATSKNGKAANATYLKGVFGKAGLGLREVPFDKVKIQLSSYAIMLAIDPNFTHFHEEDLPNVDRWVVHIPMNITKYEKGYKIRKVANIDSVVRPELDKYVERSLSGNL